jgi:hypothetical protein
MRGKFNKIFYALRALPLVLSFVVAAIVIFVCSPNAFFNDNLSISPIISYAEESHSHDGYTEWDDSSTINNASVYLTSDVHLTSDINIKKNSKYLS